MLRPASRAGAARGFATPVTWKPQCPKCNARPGQRCFSTGLRTYGTPLRDFHPERLNPVTEPIKSRVQLYMESAAKKA